MVNVTHSLAISQRIIFYFKLSKENLQSFIIFQFLAISIYKKQAENIHTVLKEKLKLKVVYCRSGKLDYFLIYTILFAICCQLDFFLLTPLVSKFSFIFVALRVLTWNENTVK